MTILKRRSVLLGAASASLAAPALAQGFPSKPIRLVVPYSAGGGADTTARLIAPKLQEALGQTVVIDNKPGAGGTIGDDFVAKASPDGHTLLIGAFAHAVNPSLMAKMPFRTPDDFVPVSLLVTVPELLVVTPSFPAKTVGELVAMAKAEPGKLSYGSSGNGSAQHLAAELFKMRTGTDIQHVPNARRPRRKFRPWPSPA
jgi:tripartite-type tricarboxylate transporter receptor subunit TctC